MVRVGVCMVFLVLLGLSAQRERSPRRQSGQCLGHRYLEFATRGRAQRLTQAAVTPTCFSPTTAAADGSTTTACHACSSELQQNPAGEHSHAWHASHEEKRNNSGRY
ncbi:hypothetical protein FA95DRAFT_1558433, partial [Auriscalpium vulgare]